MLTALLLSTASIVQAAPVPAPRVPSPSAPGQGKWVLLEAALSMAVSRGDVGGVVAVVKQDGMHGYRGHYGNASIDGMAMEDSTVFDLASLTKIVGTATSVMKLVDQGRVDLASPVARYLPEWGAGGKENITVEHLLLHQGALIPDNPIGDYENGPEVAWKNICALEPRAEAGTTFKYTDVGFITLGKLVEVVDGRTLDVFAAEEIFGPLGMVDTTFNPGPELAKRCAPTEKRDGEWMKGVVHDPRAYRMGGVTGHAGLFSTASDLSRWCEMIIGLGETSVGGKKVRILSEETVTNMTRPRWLKDRTGGRGLGFDFDSRYSSPRGTLMPRGTTFGHTGFTGTALWIDPVAKAHYVLLTNRVHPDGKGSVTPLRRAVADAVSMTLRLATVPEEYGCVTGVDMLGSPYPRRLDGRKVGLITNSTGRTQLGRRTIDVIHEGPNVELVRIFSPEHGLFAKLEGSVGDATDEATGLPVFSLYGDTRKPTPEMLDGLDTLVFDIQDVGVRYYTYISTLGLAMEACAENGVKMVVLDRPNPITGVRVSGPLCDEDRLSFIGWRPMPVTHGMTVGEIARMFQKEWGGIDCDLEVVKMSGYRRTMWWEDTAQPWINPSPNMRNPTQAVLYPCVGLLEGTNLSVGRGTDEPFELFGAPWIGQREDGSWGMGAAKLARALNGAALPGLAFTAIEFTPDASKFKGELCHGVHVTVTDRDAVRPVESGLAIIWILNRLDGRSLDLAKTDTRLMSRTTWEALVTSSDWRGIAATWADDVAGFLRRREPYLLYD